jgi:hypothetical protein
MIPLQIRDEDIAEPLKIRSRLVSNPKPPTMWVCPEPELAPNGQVFRQSSIIVSNTSLEPGTCTLVQFAVSSEFFSCLKRPGPQYFDTAVDEDNDLGLAAFWVLEISNNVLMEPSKLQTLIATCPAVDYATPVMMAP